MCKACSIIHFTLFPLSYLVTIYHPEWGEAGAWNFPDKTIKSHAEHFYGFWTPNPERGLFMAIQKNNNSWTFMAHWWTFLTKKNQARSANKIIMVFHALSGPFSLYYPRLALLCFAKIGCGSVIKMKVFWPFILYYTRLALLCFAKIGCGSVIKMKVF